MFLLLGLLAAPHALLPILWPALGVAAFLMLVARPLAVLLCLLPFRYRPAELAFISLDRPARRGRHLPGVDPVARGPARRLAVFQRRLRGGAGVAAGAGLDAGARRATGSASRCRARIPTPAASSSTCPASSNTTWSATASRPAARRCAAPRCPAACGWRWWCATARCCCPMRSMRWPRTTTRISSRPADRRRGWTGCLPMAATRSEAEQETFGLFALPGDVPLGELAQFYGLSIPARFATTTAARSVRPALRRAGAGRRPAGARPRDAGGAQPARRSRRAGGAQVRRRRRTPAERVHDERGADQPPFSVW